jgi:predicted RNA-binding Zn-ribbon protein involved in translation (DUF1610 family)
MPDEVNVNVMLRQTKPSDELFNGNQFPCPLCGLAMDIRISRRGKPYCHCDTCGIQLFFRGKNGIERLKQVLKSEALICSKDAAASQAIIVDSGAR